MAGFDYPLLFEPIPVPKVWGGGKLAGIPGRRSPSVGEPIGESWDVSTWPTAPDNPALVTVTRITNGPLAGAPLDRVTDVPVVVKVIDSSDRLSVQSHPVLPDQHKDEMWYILQAEEGAYLYLGFSEGASAHEFCELIRAETPDESRVLGMLRRCDGLRPGSHFSVPTGTAHAIGPGLLTFEISEKTQVTYRLYDYNRERSRGKLDLDAGCRAITAPRPDRPGFHPGLAIERADSSEFITAFPSFCVARLTGQRLRIGAVRTMHLVTATMGDLRVSGPDDRWNVTIPYSFTALLPPTTAPYGIDTMGGGEALISPLRDRPAT